MSAEADYSNNTVEAFDYLILVRHTSTSEVDMASITQQVQDGNITHNTGTGICWHELCSLDSMSEGKVLHACQAQY
jgi:hypothetical protein